MYKVFIQCNKKQYIGALLAKYSLKKNSLKPDQFDVEVMLVEDIPHLWKRHGEKYLRNGQHIIWSREDLQSFTLTRFLPPQLMNYEGKAIVIDPDIFATPGTDIMDLFQMDMQNKAVWACSADLGKFKTSVMLLDCKKLKNWNWDQLVDDLFAFKVDYKIWSHLQVQPSDTVGTLPEEWNHCDILTHQTKLIHYTRRLTQPWKTGLKIDFTYDYGRSRLDFLPRPIINKINAFLGRGYHYHDVYQPNPDQSQIDFFFKLAKQAYKDGALTAEFVDSSIQSKHVRPDFIEILNQLQ